MLHPSTASPQEQRQLGWLLAAGGMLLVSTDSLFIRLSEANAWDLAFLIAAFALPANLTLARVFDGRLSTQSLSVPMVLIAGLSAISKLAFFTAVTKTAVANVVVIVAAAPLLAAVASRILLGERTNGRVWMAIAASIGGIGLIVSGSLGEPQLTGDLLALLATAAFAINITLWRAHEHLSRFLTLALSSAIMLVISAFFASPFGLPVRVYLAAAAMGLAFNTLGSVAQGFAPKFAPAAEVALFTPTETVAASLWAWLFFDERPTTQVLVGGAVIVSGVLYATFLSRSPTP